MQYHQVLFASLVLILSLDFVGCSRSNPVASQTREHVLIAAKVGTSDSSHLGAKQALERYFSLETNQSYKDIYAMLSVNRVRYFRRFHVTNRLQYEELRRKSEATWRDFVVDDQMQDGAGAVKFSGHATIEETGVIDNVRFKARLINENGEWKIDKWDY